MMDSNKILSEIKNTVYGKYPDAKIILYGSRARGDFRNDSDWDLVILLNQEKITNEIEETITDPLYDLEIEFGEVISPMVYSKKDWNNKYSVTPFFKNVMTEGKSL
ncbi:nucleotidyltransferase domain-containing protein [Saccharicrinis sp. FJH54]|uniref:nucleotidyltransferase domain-containing protein n=1 Tax=Saccharicrinis sp. FJH54 TaxID=3344665 RepID=UPI0035D405F1